MTAIDGSAEVVHIKPFGSHHTVRLHPERRENLSIGDDAYALLNGAWPSGDDVDIHTQLAPCGYDRRLGGRG